MAFDIKNTTDFHRSWQPPPASRNLEPDAILRPGASPLVGASPMVGASPTAQGNAGPLAKK